MTSQEDSPFEMRTPDASELADELRLLDLEGMLEEPSKEDRIATIHARLLHVAEHLEAHEQALFKQRESLRDQLRTVRSEIRKERRLLEEAIRLREQFLKELSSNTAPATSARQVPLPREERTHATARTAPVSPVSRGLLDAAAGTQVRKKEEARPVAAQPSTSNPVEPPATRPGRFRQWAQRRANARPAEAIQESPPASHPMPANRVDEIDIPVQWWSVTMALASAVLVATLLCLGTSLSYRDLSAKQALAHLLQDSTATPKALDEGLASQPRTMLSALDAERYYLDAKVRRRADLMRLSEPGHRASRDDLLEPYQAVERATVLAPANVWYRLTKAQLAEQLQLPADQRDAGWDMVSAYAVAEPLYRQTIADHFAKVGELEWALTAYSSLIASHPERTGHALASLAEAGMKRKDYLAIVPSDPRAVLSATKFLKSSGHSDWWTYPKEPLAALAKDVANRPPAEVEAIVELSSMVSQSDMTATILADALVVCPERIDWMLQLAELRFERNELDQCTDLARQVVLADPTSEESKTARQLLQKIEVVTTPRVAGALGSSAN